MKNTIKLFIFISIFLTFAIPSISFAEGTYKTYEEARLAAQDVPDEQCYPGMTSAQIAEMKKDKSEGKKPGLVQCGRKIKCEFEVKVNKKLTLEVSDDEYIVGTTVLKSVDQEDLCDFNDVMHLVNNIINFVLFVLALPIAAIMFVYAGFTLITAGGNPSARTKAKDIFFKAAIGLAIAFVAYLIIVFVLKALGYQGDWIFNTF